MGIKRHTNTELFNAVYKLAEKSGELKKLIGIEDYHLPETYHVVTLSNYEFDTLFVANYGGSEGIYIDAYLSGIFDDGKEHKKLKLGTIKTLRTDLEAMKIMGEACGILTHFADRYVNGNLDDFTPKTLLRQWGRWPKDDAENGGESCICE